MEANDQLLTLALLLKRRRHAVNRGWAGPQSMDLHAVCCFVASECKHRKSDLTYVSQEVRIPCVVSVIYECTEDAR